MGPKGSLKAEAADLSEEAIDALWNVLAGNDPQLDLADAVSQFQRINSDEDREGSVGQGPDSVSWRDFCAALGSNPNDYVL